MTPKKRQNQSFWKPRRRAKRRPKGAEGVQKGSKQSPNNVPKMGHKNMKEVSHLDNYAPKMGHYLERSAPDRRASTTQQFSSKPTFLSDVGFGPAGPRSKRGVRGSKRKKRGSTLSSALRRILLGLESTKHQDSTRLSTAAKTALKPAPTTSKRDRRGADNEIKRQRGGDAPRDAQKSQNRD